MKNKPTDTQIEEMAFEIRRFLIDHRLWIDTCIYFNGKAFATFDKFSGEKNIANNDPTRLYSIENVDVYEHLRCDGEILSMSFGEPLSFFLSSYPFGSDYVDLRNENERITVLDRARDFVWEGLMNIFRKRGLVFEMQTQHMLTARDPDEIKAKAMRRIKEGENVWISPEEAENENLAVGWHILSKHRANALIGEHIVISDTFTKIGRQAFMFRKDVKSVIIPNGINEIGNAAFFGCENLEYIEIPDSVLKIEPLAFDETPWYDNHPDGMVYAGKVAYSYKGETPENAHIVLLEGTLAIADEVFTDHALVSIVIPDSVTYIGKGQFENCNGVFKKNVTILCRKSSYAHTYALENGIKVELCPD